MSPPSSTRWRRCWPRPAGRGAAAARADRERADGHARTARWPRCTPWPTWACASPSTTSAPATPTSRTCAGCRCTCSSWPVVRHRRDGRARVSGDGRAVGPGDEVDREVVGLVIRLAHTLGLTVTAESVETPPSSPTCSSSAATPGRAGSSPHRCRRRGSRSCSPTPWAVRREPRPGRTRSARVACPGGGVQRGDPAAPAGPGRAGGAARAHGRPVLGPQGRRRLVAAQGRARPRRRPADRGGARVHRGAGLAAAARHAGSAGHRAPAERQAAHRLRPRRRPRRRRDRQQHVHRRVAARFGAGGSSPRSTAPPGSGSTRPGAPPSAARCRSWIGSTPCWPARTRVDRAGAGYART